MNKRHVLAVLIALLIASNTALGQEPAPEDPRLQTMVLVPAGEFKMGSLNEDPQAQDDERPQRSIYLPDFYIDKWEVTNIEYKRFTDDTNYPTPNNWKDGHYQEGADFFPVVNISWWEASAYARWMDKRLPSEAEWEKAARGTDARRFPWGDNFDRLLANNGNGYEPSVSHFEGASPYGALNMAGNVAEWTATAYAPYPQGDLSEEASSQVRNNRARAQADVEFREASELEQRQAKEHFGKGHPYLVFFSLEELADTRERVYRGGSVNNYAKYLRCASRAKNSPDARWYNVGFRCVMDPPNSDHN